MVQYEYYEIYKESGICIEDKLNKLGKDGWKVVGVRPDKEYSHIILMREVSKERELQKELDYVKKELEKLINKK